MNLNVHCFRLLRCHKERNFLIKLKAKATAITARQPPPTPIPLLQITFRHYGQRPHTHITHIICSICIMPPIRATLHSVLIAEFVAQAAVADVWRISQISVKNSRYSETRWRPRNATKCICDSQNALTVCLEVVKNMYLLFWFNVSYT